MNSPRPAPIIVNRGGGTAAAAGDQLKDNIEKAFSKVGMQVDVRLVDGDEVASALRELADEPLVLVGGGDGTLGGAAFERVESGGGAMGLLPLGTRNHLARQLGIGPTLEEAAATIAAGNERKIDIGEVNGHGFVNNASIGLYPLMVRSREEQRLPKWLANVPAAWRALRRFPSHRLRLELDGKPHPVRTSLLFVGNNAYSLDAGRIGERTTLEGGALAVYAVAPRGRLALLTTALRILAGRGDEQRDFAAVAEAEAVNVSSDAQSLDVAVDGEVVRLELPLRFRIRPRSLTVLAPPG